MPLRVVAVDDGALGVAHVDQHRDRRLRGGAGVGQLERDRGRAAGHDDAPRSTRTERFAAPMRVVPVRALW